MIVNDPIAMDVVRLDLPPRGRVVFFGATRWIRDYDDVHDDVLLRFCDYDELLASYRIFLFAVDLLFVLGVLVILLLVEESDV